MADLVHNCPRCGANKITFNVFRLLCYATEYDWKKYLEVFAICGNCGRGVIFLAEDREYEKRDYLVKTKLPDVVGSLNPYLRVTGYINISHFDCADPPKYLPPAIDAAFREGARCHAIGCYNAAAAMFRQCIDLATKGFLVDAEADPSVDVPKRVIFSLGSRLTWLFDNNYLSGSLRELSTCIKEDGNDGAHDGTLGLEDSQDVQEFTFLLLERLYTESEKLKIAAKRREERRRPEAEE